MAAKKKKYNSDSIKVLTDREHVRLRTQIYLGNTAQVTYSIPIFNKDSLVVSDVEFTPAVYKAVGEIIDNSVDEFRQTNNKAPVLQITADPILGQYTITDNGRGIPIGKH